MAWDLHPWFSDTEMGPEATTSWIWDNGIWGYLSGAQARYLRGHQYKILIICIRDPQVGHTFSSVLIFSWRSSGGIQFTNFPSAEGIVPKSHKIDVPNPFNRQTGEVTTLEWSSDGYVLAVGWKHGWGLFSVGGKCLASGMCVNEFVEEERCTIMHYELFQRFIQGLDFGTSSCMVFEIWHVFHNRQCDCTQSTFLFCSFGVQEILSSFFSLLQCIEVSIWLLLSRYTEQFVSDRDGQLFVIPFAKSATTGQHTPVSNSSIFCQMMIFLRCTGQHKIRLSANGWSRTYISWCWSTWFECH